VRRLAPLVLAAIAIAGCGSSDDHETPVACLGPAPAYARALRDAPGTVRLSGNTPISECLVKNQGAGELADIGKALVKVSTDLNAAARQDPGGPPTVQLGYLVGAVARGASGTSGIHAELLRRVQAAALYNPAGKPPPEPFDHTYEKGYAAGKDHG
jgi:hypothetical protein